MCFVEHTFLKSFASCSLFYVLLVFGLAAFLVKLRRAVHKVFQNLPEFLDESLPWRPDKLAAVRPCLGRTYRISFFVIHSNRLVAASPPRIVRKPLQPEGGRAFRAMSFSSQENAFAPSSQLFGS